MRSQFASLRVLTLPFGVISGVRIVLDGINGEIRFYNTADELIGYLSPDRWYTGLEDGAHAQLDPFGGLRIYDSNGLLTVTIDAAGGVQVRDPVTGLVMSTLTSTGLHIEDPSEMGLDIDLTNGATGNVPASRVKQSTAVLPGTTDTTPAVTQFTSTDLELRHVVCWTNGDIAAQTFTPPAGYVEEFENFDTGGSATMHVTLASRDPAVPNAVRTFTSTFAAYQFDVGTTVVIRGSGTTAIDGISEDFTVDTAPADGTTVLSVLPPSGVLAGMKLVVFVAYGNDGGGIPTTWSVPDGFELRAAIPVSTGSSPADSTLACGVWEKIATQEDEDASTNQTPYTVMVISPGTATKKFHVTAVSISDPGEVGDGPDARIGGKSLARGVIHPPQILTGNSVAYGDGAVTDFVLTDVPVIAGRIYKIHLHSQFVQNTTDNWLQNLQADGTAVGRFHAYNTAAAQPSHVGDSILYLPTVTDLVTFDVQVNVIVVTFGDTIQYQAGVTAPRQFWIEDVGGDY